jgi:asparagine synthase (glutamine-hydrolysing)
MMCGISALYSPQGGLSPQLLRAVQTAVRHRGPDDEGIVCFRGPDGDPDTYGGPDTPPDAYGASLPYAPSRKEPVLDGVRLALLHRRLSILDLSPTGRQPMCTSNRECWIVYNGEIYNYLELREELRSLGHVFASQSDTEVILEAYRAWGRECLSRFNGMFAFVLFDRARRRLFAARDRFGVKPLYYWISPEGLIAFASEIKQFAVLPGWQPRVNGQRAYDFLNWALLDHTAETLFDGVHQLRGGEALDLDVEAGKSRRLAPGSRLPAYRWYDLRPHRFDGTLAAAGGKFRLLLTDSVRLRLRADVPIGSCLSGGLDSSSIVCVMNGLLREKDAHALQKTFSACSSVRQFDERDFIEDVVRHTATDAHYVYPAVDELFGALDRITWHQDEPFGSTSIYAQWHVFRLAAENSVKVMLDGQGADEQLAGYHNYFAPRFGSLLRGLRWLELWQEFRASRRLHGYNLAWGLKQALNNVLPEVLRQPLRRLAGKPGNRTPWIDIDRLAAVPRDPFLEAGGVKTKSVQAMSRSQLAATSLPMLLHWEDRDSMAHSIEARVPFLDYRLVEFALGLPDDYKIAGGETKRVLREGMRNVLPEKVRARTDKLGFVTPEEVWLKQTGTAQFRKALRDSLEASNGILTPAVLGLLEEIINGRRPFNFLIWRLISFGAWMRVFSIRA